MKGKRTVKRLLSCLLVLALAAALAPCVLADNVLVTPDKLSEAIMSASDGDTIYLSEGNFSTYATDGSEGYRKYSGKDLTFVGRGEKTVWLVGTPEEYVSSGMMEHNGDYCFDGRGTEEEETITFKNLTLEFGTTPSGKKEPARNYMGFIGIDHIEVEDCILYGMATYWGYHTTSFKNCTFNCPDGDYGYALWAYTGKKFTFDGCTFNSHGKTVNVYREGNGSTKADPIVVNFKDCTVKSDDTVSSGKSVLKVDEYGDNWYVLNFSGNNTVNGLKANSKTCSRLFQVAHVGENQSSYTTVNFDDITVWENGKMVNPAVYHNYGVWDDSVSYTNSVDGSNDSLYAEGYKDNAFTISNETEWKLSADGSHYTRNSTRVCDYCGYTEEGEEVGYKLSYDLNGGTGAAGVSYDDEIIAAGRAVKVKAAPALSGTGFTGWNTARDGSGKHYDADASIKMTANVTLYAQWEQGSSASGFAFPVGDEHIAYVSGYPDGTVRPEANITRAESAAMLYRLMPRGYFASGAQTPADVTTSDWYYSIVSQMVGSGYLTGYADGSFRGNNNVTRAEFVTMLVRLSGAHGGWCSFTDVSASHWAYDAISTAAANGWIAGYEDGTFRPDQAITRAEAMTIINRALDRGVDETSWLDDYIRWPDNHRAAWYYYEVIEATNDHYYTGSRPSEDGVS